MNTSIVRRTWSLVTHSLRNTRVAQLRQMSEKKPRWIAGPLTLAALRLATESFASKPRKGGDTPYLSHLLAVSALVMEHGGTEVQAAGGLLHDAFEDVKITADELSRRLEQRGASQTDAAAVATIVRACTDGTPDQRRDGEDWLKRKQGYVATLAVKPADHPALLVSLADKVHNIEVTLRELRGGTTAEKLYGNPWFNAKAPEQKWYYSELARVFGEKLGGNSEAKPLVERLTSAVDEIFRGVEDWQP
jgi:(p)ppGpp synthase/HD superfamily hydrolase